MKRTSRTIVAKLDALTAHISPYAGGLARETHRWVEELNAEAIRASTGVRYRALANKIEAYNADPGADPEAIGWAARDRTTLGGWFLRQAITAGYAEGEAVVLRRGNSHHRKQLRKQAKTRDAQARDDEIQRLIDKRMEFRWRVEDVDRRVVGAIVPGNWPKRWIGGRYSPVKELHNKAKYFPAAE
jgi:hypothetical protein